MCDIYGSSTCNIAASDAHNSTEGCLFSYDSRVLQLQAIDGSTYLANQTELFQDHPLYSRAWVFQESFLSSRSLNFGRAQVFWKCGQLCASQLFPEGFLKHYPEYHPAMRYDAYSFRRQPIKDRNFIRNSVLDPEFQSRIQRRGLQDWHTKPIQDQGSDSLNTWADIVQLYTETQLTKAEDRAIAIFGVTESLKPFYGQYISGAWRKYLPRELVWISRTKGRKVYPSRAPSWSWLAMEGNISYEFCRLSTSQDTLLADVGIATFKGHFEDSRPVYQGPIYLHAPILSATWSGNWRMEKDLRIERLNGQANRTRLFGIPLLNRGWGKIYFDNNQDSPHRRISFALVF
jgi:hypothetical protein